MFGTRTVMATELLFVLEAAGILSCLISVSSWLLFLVLVTGALPLTL